jgi:hypothetical protein
MGNRILELATWRVPLGDTVPKALHEFDKFVKAAVNVADDIKRPMPPPAVTRQRTPHDQRVDRLFWFPYPVTALEGFF